MILTQAVGLHGEKVIILDRGFSVSDYYINRSGDESLDLNKALFLT